MASIYIIKKFKNGKEVGFVSLRSDDNATYLDSKNAPHEFLMEADAVKVAEFKNWYATLAQLDVRYRVFETSVTTREIELAKHNHLADRPTVEIEDPDAKGHEIEIEE
ncbi:MULTISPECIES: hypothetical protein [unclassified Streptococcus]|uniref:hypothetical protein n=1 Tax=unclassified Streptococcus TaxID=2608887 RepID=UPI00211B5957|nr:MULTISPECIES: hypothetical protein [unclassified Streptococcus]MCQ9211664.1 hypothetical protein [Streptococcus sp. B01]MCQ9215056.1 hypothetical protein [Streptococcus sp. O1]